MDADALGGLPSGLSGAGPPTGSSRETLPHEGQRGSTVQTGGADGPERRDTNNPGFLHRPGHLCN